MEKKFDFRMLEVADTTQILQLRNAIWDALEDKTLFAQSSDFCISESLKNGFGFGVWQENKLVACIICRCQDGEYAELLQYSGQQKEKTVELEDVFVNQQHRGQGLQKYLIQQAETYARKIDKSIILATVSPQNLFSIRNFENMGYDVVKSCMIYENLERYILQKRLDIPKNDNDIKEN